MKREIIAFLGRQGSGKSYQSNILVKNRGFKKVSFADPLRDIAFATIGMDFNEGMSNYDNLKKTTLFNGQNFRNILENLGGAVRKYDKDFWANSLVHHISESTDNIVIDDLRYVNEYLALEDYCKQNDCDFRVYYCKYESDVYVADNRHQSAALSNYLAEVGYNNLQLVDREDILSYERITDPQSLDDLAERFDYKSKQTMQDLMGAVRGILNARKTR